MRVAQLMSSPDGKEVSIEGEGEDSWLATDAGEESGERAESE
jgi:hypothetical protein